MSLLLLDNHDSFTWNLVELLRSCGKVNVKILTPEQLQISEINCFEAIIFSPGPGLPQEQPLMFGILSAVEELIHCNEKKISVFGVCLGLQAIALHFGGSLLNLSSVVHGQQRKLKILQPAHPLFKHIPDESDAGLYHSWAVDPDTLPGCLETLAVTTDGTIMAVAHKTLPVWGVQYHPESFMTPTGKTMIENWLRESTSS